MLQPAVPVAEGLAAWTVAGLGMGLAYAPLSLMMLQKALPGQEGQASASLNLTDVLGTAIGIGVGGAAVAAAAGNDLRLGIPVAFAAAAAAALVALAFTGRCRDDVSPAAGRRTGTRASTGLSGQSGAFLSGQRPVTRRVGEDAQVAKLAGRVGVVGRAERKDVHRVQPAAGVAYLVSAELPADVGERVAIIRRGRAQGIVEGVGASVEREAVLGAQPDAGARLGQVVQVGIAEQHDLGAGRVSPDGLQGGVEPGRQLADDKGPGGRDGVQA